MLQAYLSVHSCTHSVPWRILPFDDLPLVRVVRSTSLLGRCCGGCGHLPLAVLGAPGLSARPSRTASDRLRASLNRPVNQIRPERRKTNREHSRTASVMPIWRP